MMEVVQGEGGVMPLDEAYVKGAAKLCEQYDLLLICDEVQIGNGRSGKLYGYMHYGVQPDIVSTAKGLAGGLPLGATLLGSLHLHSLAEFLGKSVDVNLLEQVIDGFGAYLGDELGRIAVGKVGVAWQSVQSIEVIILGKEFHLRKIALTRVDYYVFLIVDDSLEFLCRNAEKGGNLVRSALEVPDVCYRNGKGDVAHTLTAHLLLSNLDITSVADYSAVTDSLVLSAIAFVILGRAEDFLAEETVPLRLVGPVVDRFRLQDLSAGPFDNVLRRSKRDADSLEIALGFCFLIVESRHISI